MDGYQCVYADYKWLKYTIYKIVNTGDCGKGSRKQVWLSVGEVGGHCAAFSKQLFSLSAPHCRDTVETLEGGTLQRAASGGWREEGVIAVAITLLRVSNTTSGKPNTHMSWVRVWLRSAVCEDGTNVIRKHSITELKYWLLYCIGPKAVRGRLEIKLGQVKC